MGLLATLPRATRGHLGASNNTLTRATRGWLQSAAGVVVRRPSGGLFLQQPAIEWLREEEGRLVVWVDLVARVALVSPDIDIVREPMVLVVDLVGEARLDPPEPKVVPLPVTQVTPSVTPAPAPASASADAPALQTHAPQRHPQPLVGETQGGLWLYLGGDAVLLDPMPALVAESEPMTMWVALGGDVELTAPTKSRRGDEDLVLIAALLDKELNDGR